MKNIIRNFIRKDIIIVFSSLLFVSLIINLTQLDILIQKFFFIPQIGWFLKNSQPWIFFYHYSFIPALLISIAGLFLFGRSFISEKNIRYRKIAVFLILVMALGPGLFVNLVFKENWGRPRPRNIKEFDGKYNYEKVLTIDLESDGKSFPCGHCSMGFFFLSFYFIFRKRKKYLSMVSLVFALSLGGLIGFARIVQGGHFFSDVLWAGGITYITTAVIFYSLNMDKNIFYIPKDLSRFKKYHSIHILMYVLMSILVLLVLLATPYNKSKTYRIKKIDSRNYNRISAQYNLLESNVEINLDSLAAVAFKGEGFGFPKSRIKNKWKYSLADSTLILNFNQKKSGFLTEIDLNNTIYIDKSNSGEYEINLKKSNVIISLDDTTPVEIIIFGNPNITMLNKTYEKLDEKHFRIKKGSLIKLTINIPEGDVKLI